MAGETLTFDANIETRKKLVGIATNVQAKSVSNWLSSGATVLSTEKEVKDTKEVNILIPFLVGVKKVADVLTEAQTSGGVKTSKLPLGERVVKLENELITDPVMYRPRSTAVLQADVLLDRYKAGFVVSATVVKDRAYFNTIVVQGKAGLSTGEKIEIVDTTAAHAAASLSARGEAFTELINEATVRIMEFTDGIFQGDFDNNDIAITTTPSIHKAINQFKAKQIRTDASFKDYATNSKVQLDGLWDGLHEFKSTKQIIQAKIDFLVMIKGAAVSQFLFMDLLNYDKIGGVNAYKLSLEFNEGTGVYFPQLITIGAKTADHAAQVAVGSGSIDLMKEVGTSTTTSKNPAAAAKNAK